MSNELGRAWTRPVMVGRNDLMTAVTDALADDSSMVLVEGEPGIGKTRLLEEVLSSDRIAGRTVLVAACPPLREPFPLGPVVDAARGLVERADVDGPGGLGLSALAGALRPLFPEWADELPPPLEPPDEPAETRRRLLRALTELVTALAVDVVVVEDAHWADAATLEWLLTMTSVAEQPASVLLTYRPTDVADDSPLSQLRSRTPVGMTRLRVELRPLDVEQTRRLVGSMLGTDDVSERFAEFLHERTDGIPLAVEESVRLLRDRFDIVRHDGRWSRRVLDQLEVPPTVRDSVLERVGRLPPEAQRLLAAAAVVAEPADEKLLGAVADLDGPAARRGVAAALTAGVLRETAPGLYRFRHVLDCEAVEQSTPVSERRRLHRRAGQALESTTPPPVARLARHFKEAGDVERWCDYAEHAADLALCSSDDRTAITVLLDVLQTVEVPTARRARLSHQLGEAAVHGYSALGDLGERTLVALRRTLDVPDLPADARGDLRLMLGRLHMQLGEYDAAYAEIEASLPDLADRPTLMVRATLFLAVPVSPGWPAARHLEWLDRTTALEPQIGTRWERLSYLADRAMTLLLLGRDDGWRVAAEIPDTAETRAEQQEIARGMLNVGQYAITWGRFTEAAVRLQRAADVATEIGFHRLLAATDVAGALLDWHRGRWNGLRERLSAVIDADDVRALTRTEARLVRGLLDLAEGDHGTAEDELSAVLDHAARLGFAEPGTTLAAAALGRIHLADGEPARALQVTRPVLEMIERKDVWLWAGDIARVHCSALVGVGDVDEAERVTRHFATGLGDVDAPGPRAAVTTCRALIAEARGDRRTAGVLFGDAAAAWATLPRPYDAQLALERRGVHLLDEERAAGVELLTSVESRLRELGARRDADRVAHTLRGLGVEVPRAWRSGPRGYGDRLSPREREVLALVAQGMTNRDAARVLFLSPRTVGRHLGTAMRKLGVSTRTAAAMAATEAGLIPAGPRAGDRRR